MQHKVRAHALTCLPYSEAFGPNCHNFLTETLYGSYNIIAQALVHHLTFTHFWKGKKKRDRKYFPMIELENHVKLEKLVLL